MHTETIKCGEYGLYFDGFFWYIGVYFGARLRIARRATVSDFKQLGVSLHDAQLARYKR